MRGFPIVSLGSVSTITIKSDRFSTQILSPNFEKQEYFENNENDTIEYWKKKYSKAYEFGYIKNISIQENNIDSTNGDMSFISYSTGFDPYVDIEDIFKITSKLEKLKNVRVDSFYSIKIDVDFLHNHLYSDDDSLFINKYPVEKIVINIPNVQVIENRFALNISRNIDEIQFNAPKLAFVDYYFFEYYIGVKRIYFNAPLLNNVGYDTFLGWKNSVDIYATSSEDLARIIEMLILNKSSKCNAEIEAKGVVDLSAFDLRYWSTYENETGLDVGLLEGSNLR